MNESKNFQEFFGKKSSDETSLQVEDSKKVLVDQCMKLLKVKKSHKKVSLNFKTSNFQESQIFYYLHRKRCFHPKNGIKIPKYFLLISQAPQASHKNRFDLIHDKKGI